MKRLLPTLSLLALAGCDASAIDPSSGENEVGAVDLLVAPPTNSGLPMQVLLGVDFGNGDPLDIELSSGVIVRGHVEDADGNPVDNASVRVTMQGTTLDRVFTTGNTGIFEAALGPGMYDIEVTPDRDLDPDLPPRQFLDVEIDRGDDETDRMFAMPSGYRVSGVVRGPDGQPLPAFRVSARRDGAIDRSTYDLTDFQGNYSIVVPDPGEWLLQIAPSEGASGAPSAQKRFTVTDAETSIPFQFPLFDEFDVSGIVEGAGALTATFSGIVVRARAQLPSEDPDVTITFDRSTTTSASGYFTLPVLQGTYTVTIEPSVSFPYSHRVLPAMEVASDLSLPEGSTTLLPKATIEGTAQATGGPGSSDAQVRLVSSDGTPYQFATRSDRNGRYELSANLGAFTAEVLPAPESGLVRFTTSIVVSNAQQSLDFGLEPGLEVGGKVVDPDGEPMANVLVQALDPVTHLPVGSAEWVTGGSGSWSLTVPF